ncbi:MAG: rRNA maturation RNase YbeY [Minisyncoccia bacterium]|jgi:probable rRNA maturation factor
MDKKLARLAKKILRIVGGRNAAVRTAALDVFLLPDREIAVLKRRFFKKKTEPNVLSFPEPLCFPHPETKRRYLGEIYLNRDLLRRDPERAAPLLLHGILHLLGYDHKKKAGAAKMEKLEKNILRRSGKT